MKVYSHELVLITSWSDRRWGDVYDVTELPDNLVAVASSKGLFLVSPGGWTVATLKLGVVFCSCVVINGCLFAYCACQQMIFKYKLMDKRWQNVKDLNRDHLRHSWAKLAVSENNTIIYGGSIPDIICEVRATDGELVEIRDRTDAGDGHHLLCAADASGSILVADKQNDRLQVCVRSGGWAELNLDPPVEHPQSAVVINNKLFVSSDGGNRLTLYTAQVRVDSAIARFLPISHV